MRILQLTKQELDLIYKALTDFELEDKLYMDETSIMSSLVSKLERLEKE